MRIAAVHHVVPTERITNAWIKERIRADSAGAMDATELAAAERLLDASFESAGTSIRYRLNGTESALHLVAEAGRNALREAEVVSEDVEFLIYAGVGRGWIEPATAPIVQAELGLRPQACFDILDACASWIRALHVAHTFIRSGTYRCGLIVNAECGFRHYAALGLARPSDLDERFATCTIGEAATATVVIDDGSDHDWHFAFGTFGEHADLCTIPLPAYDAFAPAGLTTDRPTLRFHSRSRELMSVTTRKIVEVFRGDPILSHRTYDVCFGHSASEKAVRIIAKQIQQPYEIYYSTHPDYGNTVSAAVPLGMSLASRDGRLRRGSRVLIIVGASGISVGIASLTF